MNADGVLWAVVAALFLLACVAIPVLLVRFFWYIGRR